MQTNLNTDEVTNHSDLLSQAVQEIYSPLADTIASDSSDHVSENSHETVINTEMHNTYANLIHKLDLRNVQLYNQRITIINMQDELLEVNEKLSWQLSANHLQHNLQLKEYNLSVADRLHTTQIEKLELAHQFIDAQNLQITTLSKQLYQLRIIHEKVKQDLRTLQTQNE